jgi:hypothetical protein
MKTRRNFYLALLVITVTCQAASFIPKVIVKTTPKPPLKTIPTFTYNLDPSMY